MIRPVEACVKQEKRRLQAGVKNSLKSLSLTIGHFISQISRFNYSINYTFNVFKLDF
jgi:hypothetical protein